MIRLFLKRYHQFKNRAFYARLIRPGDLCFDIGANIGSKSKVFLAAGARVIAFEPQSACLKELAAIKNPDFSFHAIAVGARDEIRQLRLSHYSEVATLSDEFIEAHRTADVYWATSEKVFVRSLSHLIEEFGLPDFCKIDVEGFELEIMAALKHTLPLIELEFTGKLLHDTLKIIDLLNDRTYRFNYALNEQPKLELSHWVTAEEIAELLADLPRQKLHGNLFCRLLT